MAGKEGGGPGDRAGLGSFSDPHQLGLSGGEGSKTAGAPFLLEGKNPFGYSYQSGWGVGGAALHYFANLPRLLPNDFKIRSEHQRALDWPISYQDVAPY